MWFEFSAEVTERIEEAEQANSPIKFYNLKDGCYQGIHSCEGDMIVICNAMIDYADLLMEFIRQWDYEGYQKAFYQIHAERCRKISLKLQEQIGYDREAAMERCRAKRNRREANSDVGEEAMVLMIKRSREKRKVRTMGEKIFGEIQTTEELNELANNLRKTKEFDEIRLLCSENGISEEIAEEFIKGNRLLLSESGKQEEAVQHAPVDEDYVPMGTASLKDIVLGIPKPTEEEIKQAEKEQRTAVIYTVEDARKKLEEELKIYRDGDSKYVVEKLIELCTTDEALLNAIMLPHKSYDKAFQYFYQQSRNIGYKMPHGNMVYLDNDKAVELSVEYFKRDDSAVEKKKVQRKEKPNPQPKPQAKRTQRMAEKEEKKKPKTEVKKTEMDKVPERPKSETKKKNSDMDGQMSLFDF